MAISEKLTYLNTTKTLIKDNLNLGGANISNEPFRVYSSKLIDIYKDFLANGTDVVWNNWLPKVTGSGETITLNNTIEAKMDFVYKGNTSQEGTPTPEAPQDIHVVSGDNSINVCGKNLFDKDNATISNKYISNDGSVVGANDWVCVENYLEIKPNTTYIASMKNMGARFIWCEYNSSQQTIRTRQENTTGIMTTSSTAKYIRFCTNNNTANDIQLELGSSASQYEPYQSQNYPINLGTMELCKIGTYQDKIYKDNGKWYLNKQIGKVVLDGTKNWIRSGNTSESFFCGALAGVNIPFEAKMGTASDSKTNYFVKGNKGSNAEVFDMYNGTDYYTTFALYLSTSRATDVTTFKNWLGTHNVILYYVLATPTITEITDSALISQLETVKRSFNGQTNITQTNDDKPFILDATALKQLTQEEI